MTGFTPQFVERFLNPLLKQIMTDMADPPEDKQYLKRLTIGLQSEKLQQLEREKFFSDYFRADKTKPFSGTDKEDLDFQNEFLETFVKSFDLHKGLSGVDGVKKLYFPEGEKDKEKTFTGDAEKNIYRMAYKLSLVFEKKRIEELMKKEKGEVSEKDRENIALGKVKLIIVDGVERYITEEEAKVAAQNPAASKIKVQTYSGDEKTLGELPAGFSEAKAASLEMALEENGLEVVEPIKPDPQNPQKFATGVVKDASGQKLDVKIDLDAKSSDPKKMTFTFRESPPGKPNRKGETFTSSQDDLKRFKSDTGERRTAEEVAHPGIGQVAKEKPGSVPEAPFQPGSFAKLPPLSQGMAMSGMIGGEESEGGPAISMRSKAKPRAKGLKALLPFAFGEGQSPVGQGAKVGVNPPSKKQTTVSIPEDSLIVAGGNAPTIVDKKKAVAEAKAEAPGGVLPPQSPFLQQPQGPGVQQTASQPKKSGAGRWIVAAHAGTFGGLLGAGAWRAISSDPEATKKVVVMVLKTIGLA